VGDRTTVAQRHAAIVADACRRIERAEIPLNLDALAADVGLSPFHFHRVFHDVIGLTPKAYAAAFRARRVRERLAKGAKSISGVIYDTGFSSNGRFYEASERLLGMKPKEYRAGGTNAEIRFAVGRCSLGDIVVANSQRGVCAILLGDDPEQLVRDLQDQFPNAALIGSDPAFEELVARVVAFVEAPSLGLDLPLDIRGTAFQERVWRALRATRPGDTVSYAEIAKRIGRPSAVRAVAQACAKNHIAVAIPCHRVVRSDGGLSGYRWGIERKRELLERELSATSASPGRQE
jgi:AraC family transcriptional regulator of adaptative response/methylated-DNA-[protein]-cysteine methyltransferase